ncbi:conserved hypothetical protein [Candidatus Protochlamydia naegleriophila]|uniref:Phosphoribosyltransferase domain-containing protein n=1 Tax=Candidatus Protochlamydia naegleriophila TaxID=389348 RepID=A0A0U5K378_9BACT|nr:phosphoribosyltransferase family protein [Candidatus Protochlamydia naegleriophila]CUI16555.1 conserved hypothetical protein [Candidatus Protochlamydia naegleriophila]
MVFKNRRDAGKQLCKLLTEYQGQETVIYAIPRGGIVVAEPLANYLAAPIDLLLCHKIGHPYQPEYAIAAISESGHVIGNPREIMSIDQKWFQNEKKQQVEEIKRKRKAYLKERGPIPLQGKIAVIVDDGIATGLTMQAGIKELRDRRPSKIIVAVPIAPKSTADIIKNVVDEFIAVDVPSDESFLGAVGAYYDEFYQVEDDEVIAILDLCIKEAKKYKPEGTEWSR